MTGHCSDDRKHLMRFQRETSVLNSSWVVWTGTKLGKSMSLQKDDNTLLGPSSSNLCNKPDLHETGKTKKKLGLLLLLIYGMLDASQVQAICLSGILCDPRCQSGNSVGIVRQRHTRKLDRKYR